MTTKIKAVLFAVAMAALLSINAYIYYLNYNIEKYKSEVSIYKHNADFYEGQLSKAEEEKKVLQLSIKEIENSKDSAMKVIAKLRKENSINGKNKPGDLHVYGSGNVDIVKTIVIDNTKKIELDTVVVFNEKTKSHIKIDSTGLTNKLDIDFGIYFVIGERREYVNARKNWFDRFIHFDYKKETVIRYNYKFTNDAMKPEDVRVIIERD